MKINLMRPAIARRLCTPGIDEPSMLRSGWCSCIKETRVEVFLTDDASQYFLLLEIKAVRGID